MPPVKFAAVLGGVIGAAGATVGLGWSLADRLGAGPNAVQAALVVVPLLALIVMALRARLARR